MEKDFAREYKETALRTICREVFKKLGLKSSLLEWLKDFINTPDSQPVSQSASLQPVFQLTSQQCAQEPTNLFPLKSASLQSASQLASLQPACLQLAAKLASILPSSLQPASQLSSLRLASLQYVS